MKHIKLFEGFGKFDEDHDESVQLLINKAKDKFNSSTEDWFDRTDLDKYLSGEDREFEHSETDAAYFQLFPQDLLTEVESTLHNVPTEMTRVEASIILRGLKEDGYKIIKK